jgi:citrate synthase
MASTLLSADQVAARLGVKLPTVYAYVSRGVLHRTVAVDGRTSQFDPAEVEALARRGRPRGGTTRVGSVDVSLATSITGILDNRLVYRGYDATDLAAATTFESVAELLWTGELPAHSRWPAVSGNDEIADVPRSIRQLLPVASPAAERFAVTAAALACAQPLRVDLRPEAVHQHARVLLGAFVEVLPPVGAKRVVGPRVASARTRAEAAATIGDRGSSSSTAARSQRLAARLWPKVSPRSATRAGVAVLEAALILLADHELATSTLAARVAASTRADPYAVVLAGLGAVSGPLHGKAAMRAHQLLLDGRTAPDPAHAVARVLSGGGTVPGFGHPVYAGIDPRAACLLDRLTPVARAADQRVIEGVMAASATSDVPEPNVDFALGALAFATDMPLGATEAVFALARTAGWIAHALEEYAETPLRFRSRAIYVGPTHRSQGLNDPAA